MKLARYTVDGRTTIGVVHRDQVIDLERLDPAAPKTIRELLALGVAGRSRIAEALRDAARRPSRSRRSGSKRRSPTRRSTSRSA